MHLFQIKIFRIQFKGDLLIYKYIPAVHELIAYAELNLNREILLKSADDALYRAKDKGRNRVQVVSTINAP